MQLQICVGVHTCRRAVQSQINHTRQQISEERGDIRRRQKVALKLWRLTDHIKYSALVMYVLADYDAQPAVVYLKGIGRARSWPIKNSLELQRLIEDLLLGADLELLMRRSVLAHLQCLELCFLFQVRRPRATSQCSDHGASEALCCRMEACDGRTEIESSAWSCNTYSYAATCSTSSWRLFA